MRNTLIKFFFKCLLVEFIVIGGFLFSVVQAYGDTPARVLSGGRVEFAYGQVGPKPAWGQAEYDQMVADCPECVTQIFTPASWEINLSTTVKFMTDLYPAFQNYSDWFACKTKTGLKKKIKAMRLEYDSMTDLPAADKVDIKQRYDWLKSYYLTLP